MNKRRRGSNFKNGLEAIKEFRKRQFYILLLITDPRVIIDVHLVG
jgi:hypothetical protein